MRLGAAFAVLWLVAFAGAASGEIYRWTDESGRIHFTQSLDQVPPRYREAARAGAAAPASPRIQTYSRSSEPAAPAAAASRASVGGTLRIPFERHGTLMKVDVVLNDHLAVPFYVDTGASGVSLPQGVADRLGLYVGPGSRHVYVRTANGVAARAVVTLDSVQLGGARVENLEATVNPSMDIGLLGGAFFNNFIYRVDAAESVIELQENDGIRGGLGADEWRARFRRIREPLSRLEAYLESREVSRPERRAELERQRLTLRSELEELELEANRVDVPAAWRE